MKKLIITSAIFLMCGFLNVEAQNFLLTRNNSCLFSCQNGPSTVTSSRQVNANDTVIIKEIFNLLSLHPKYTVSIVRLYGGIAASYLDNEYNNHIILDQDAIQQINSDYKSKWPAIFIIAHECAHQLNGKWIDPLKRRNSEIDADEFAGNVLLKMGATLIETLAAIKSLNNDECGDHPGKSVRLAAAKRGWEKGNYERSHQNFDLTVTEEKNFKIADNFDINIKDNPIDFDPDWQFIQNPSNINFVVDNRVSPRFSPGAQSFNVQLAGYAGKAAIWFNPFVTCDCIADLEIPNHSTITETVQTFRLTNFRKFPRDKTGVVGGPCMGLYNSYFAGGWKGRISLSVNRSGVLNINLLLSSYSPNGSLSYSYSADNIIVPAKFIKPK